ncbi:DUF4974 domain-containing protein [Marinilongibacter aquaticus]|uniref:FecR family protein n=1 Tax=Marinilongibacter aquaticus TaxID=2975157 RepID=UPI0021BD4FAF|nr:FecR family protein [Marinilongibacter aquaticus]UBM58669.1 DUF4974 domain-containing protein [Marinilongibacter aquaticus]
MNNLRLTYLFQRYYENNITEEESREWMDFLSNDEYKEQIRQLIDSKFLDSGQEIYTLPDQKANDMLDHILDSTKYSVEEEEYSDEESVHTWFNLRWAKTLLAASVSLVFLYGAYNWLSKKQESVAGQPEMISAYGGDAKPGKNRAILTLEDGKTVDLSQVGSGYIAGDSAVMVDKSKGEIKYSGENSRQNPSRAKYNTLTTPRGGQYKIVLPDGTQAWLNAGSQIKYPTCFRKGQRVVEIKGEVYFEVAHNPNKPFSVRIHKPDKKVTEINVLGTHFNVSSYDEDHRLKTTLLEGSVKIKNGNKEMVLKPGQQAEIPFRTNSDISINEVDTKAVIAWKEGRFEFNGCLEDIMRQITRWYDMDVKYEGDVGSKSFAGAVSRKENVSEVLKMLELTGGVQFTIEGHVIHVKSAVQ